MNKLVRLILSVGKSRIWKAIKILNVVITALLLEGGYQANN